MRDTSKNRAPVGLLNKQRRGSLTCAMPTHKLSYFPSSHIRTPIFRIHDSCILRRLIIQAVIFSVVSHASSFVPLSFRIHDSRNELEKPTNQAPLGSYVSMLATRMAASEDSSVWDLARDVMGQAGEVLEKRKNFTDVAVLELLFNTVRSGALFHLRYRRAGTCSAEARECFRSRGSLWTLR